MNAAHPFENAGQPRLTLNLPNARPSIRLRPSTPPANRILGKEGVLACMNNRRTALALKNEDENESDDELTLDARLDDVEDDDAAGQASVPGHDFPVHFFQDVGSTPML